MGEERPNRGGVPALREDREEHDARAWAQVTRTQLSAEVEASLRAPEPASVQPEQDRVLAIHWHPEFVPMGVIRERFERMFPARQDELVIPTQHNQLLSWGDLSGVEVDGYAASFKRKVQLLVHLPRERAEGATRLKDMLDHTFRYRNRQLEDFLAALIEPGLEERRQRAAKRLGGGVDEDLVAFVAGEARRLRALIELRGDQADPIMIRNKLIRDWFDLLRDREGAERVDRAQAYLRAVKREVKAHFDPSFFFKVTEIIEEARAQGAGIIVPHPEQFWPILLADYDIDGYEVWNPQSADYTAFLIDVVGRLNRQRARTDRPLLITMGDDCHMGEKTKAPALQDRGKAAREVGLQPAWQDEAIRASLERQGFDRARVIREYRDRLGAGETTIKEIAE